jgi:hypothetical protein
MRRYFLLCQPGLPTASAPVSLLLQALSIFTTLSENLEVDPREPFARRQHPSDGPGERCQKCQNIRTLQRKSSTVEVLTTFCSTIFGPPAMTAPPASISRTCVSGPLLVD